MPEPNSVQKRTVAKRSVVIDGRKTSISMESEFWISARQIADERNIPLKELVAQIDRRRQDHNLSSAIRVFILDHYKSRAAS